MNDEKIKVRVTESGDLLEVVVLRKRPERVAELYRSIWSPGGSPLRVQSERLAARLAEMTDVGSKKSRLAVQVGGLSTRAFPMRVPHAAVAELLVSYASPGDAESAETHLRETLGKRGPRWRLETLSDRPPLVASAESRAVADSLLALAKELEMPLKAEGSTWPSVAGLAPAGVATLCGLAPVAQALNTPDEAVARLSLVQRTLLVARLLQGEGA